MLFEPLGEPLVSLFLSPPSVNNHDRGEHPNVTGRAQCDDDAGVTSDSGRHISAPAAVIEVGDDEPWRETMLQGVADNPVFVRDEDRALDFYTNGSASTWGSSTQPPTGDGSNRGGQGAGLSALSLAGTSGQAQPVEGRIPGAYTIDTGDCREAFEWLKSRGVLFETDVLESPWAYLAVFRDPEGIRRQLREVLSGTYPYPRLVPVPTWTRAPAEVAETGEVGAYDRLVTSEDWRVEVELDDEQHGYSLGERLRAFDLDDAARERLGRHVIVTRDGSKLFLYTSTRDEADEATRIVRELTSAESLTAEIRTTAGIRSRRRGKTPPCPCRTQSRTRLSSANSARNANSVKSRPALTTTGTFTCAYAIAPRLRPWNSACSTRRCPLSDAGGS